MLPRRKPPKLKCGIPNTKYEYSRSSVIRLSIILTLDYPNWVTAQTCNYIHYQYMHSCTHDANPFNIRSLEAFEYRKDIFWKIISYMYKHVRVRRYCRYGIRRTTATNSFGRTRRRRVADKWTTGYIGELLSVVSALADGKLSMSGIAWEVWGTVFRSKIYAPTYGCGDRRNWPVQSIIHSSELFTYPNELFVAFGHWGSDKGGSTVLTF